MATCWTPERRARQSVLIANWKPWQHATGPRTAEGKARASRNAYKGGRWLKLRELAKMVHAEIRQARELVKAR
jgi:hypothetical protein